MFGTSDGDGEGSLAKMHTCGTNAGCYDYSECRDALECTIDAVKDGKGFEAGRRACEDRSADWIDTLGHDVARLQTQAALMLCLAPGSEVPGT